ncbi:zinc finger protein 239 [Nematolebias whitei]|uniref:zinc finger protein 239 n=1 Tax=Nematolebias whitei TaxID=451745 RepID=UPI00189BA51C|nr:zinc finger protein 239 [Nematolebias whitei]
MASRLSLHLQLSTIMETMAKSVLGQVFKVVDEDSAKLRSELSRLQFANTALAEKVHSLECELTIVRNDSSKLCKSHRSLGVQTGSCRDEEAPDVPAPLTIDEIFGKDWCMNLWKDKDSLQKRTDSSQFPEKSVETLSDEVTVTDVKEGPYLPVAAPFSQQKTLNTKDHEESMAEESKQLSVDYSVDGSSTSSLLLEQAGEQVMSAGCTEKTTVQMISVNDTDKTFSSPIISIDLEDDDDVVDDDDDDVQFVQASQQEPAQTSAAGPSQDKQQLLPVNTENHTAAEENSHGDINVRNGQSNTASNIGTLTCQICSRTFFHTSTLTNHMKSHKSNFCSICKQYFPQGKKNSHSCVPPVSSQRNTKSCNLCGKRFNTQSALRTHHVVHTGEKPYKCGLCEKRFTQKGNLKCHLRIHTGDRPFRCTECGKTFTQKVNLSHHVMAHLNRDIAGETPDGQKQVEDGTAETCL